MASVTVNPPKTPVTEGSMGIAAATVPNVCKMPGPPAPFVPVPLPNIGKSGDSPAGYSTSVKIEGSKVAIRGATFKSMGDIASKATGGGIVSSNTHGETSFAGPGSMDVKIEGKNVQLLSDPMLNNNGPSGSPPNSATLLGLVQPPGVIAVVGDEKCPLCGETHGDAARLAETDETQRFSNDLNTAIENARKNIENDARSQNEQRQQAYQTRKAQLERLLTENNIARMGSSKASQFQREQRGLKEPEIIPGPGHWTMMLAVVVCRHHSAHVYAANSGQQSQPLSAPLLGSSQKAGLLPTTWHLPPSLKESGKQTRARYRRHIKTRGFRTAWYNANKAVELFDKTGDKPAYPPGTCAGPQAILLAMEHGAIPTGLTERFYDSTDANAKTPVYARRELNDRTGTKEYFGGQDAVPPCASCELVLPMLLCPNDREPECAHRAATEPDTCRRCQP